MVKIGWSQASIAMEGNVFIPGQMALRFSQGTHTPVIASALALENNGDAVVFVSLDMVSITSALAKLVRETVSREIKDLPPEKIILNATHTHAGPGDRDLPDFPHPFKIIGGQTAREYLARQIVTAVREAWENRAPGSIAYGYGFATTGHSRRVVYLDDVGKRIGHQPGYAVNGHAKMYGNTNDDMFDGYEAGTDTFINLLYTFDTEGKLTGAIVNVPCPAQNNEGTWNYYAGFWHNVREKLTAKYGHIGVIAQTAAAGDLAPRQLHYLEAEKRRYALKYPDKIKAYLENPLKIALDPGDTPERRRQRQAETMEMMRAEDIANRIVAAFDEVLSWASKDKQNNPRIIHKVCKTELSARMFPADVAAEEKETYKKFMSEKYQTEGEPFDILINNSKLNSYRRRCKGVITRYENQNKVKTEPATIHAVRIGDVAFATSKYELFLDYMHRIQARSPFVQTFIVQLADDELAEASYLATERAIKNKGYSASPYCNQVSAEGGQQMVNKTLELLKEMK